MQRSTLSLRAQSPGETCHLNGLWILAIRTMVCFGEASLVAQIRNRPAMQETQVQSQGQEDSMEKGMATHSSILAWRIPWPEEPGRLQSMESCLTE